MKEAIFSLCYPRNYLVSVLPCAWYRSARKCQSAFTLRGNRDRGTPTMEWVGAGCAALIITLGSLVAERGCWPSALAAAGDTGPA